MLPQYVCLFQHNFFPSWNNCIPTIVLIKRSVRYRRLQQNSESILTCPRDSSHACHGGALWGSNLCSEGYEGIMCGVCSSGYFYSTSTNSCEKCEGVNLITPPFIILLCVLLPLVVTAILLYHKYSKEWDKIDSTGLLPLHIKLYKWCKQRYSEYVSKLKVMISTFQIICTSSTVLQVTVSHAQNGTISI